MVIQFILDTNISPQRITFFRKKFPKTSKIALVDKKGNTLSEHEKIAETFNKFFGNIIKNLNISINSEVWRMFR